MNIIEESTRKKAEFLENITKKAWKKWLAIAVVLLLLAGGVILLKYFPLVFSTFDLICIGLFTAVIIYIFIQMQRLK
jgi:uncharacterized membrane protein